MNILLQGKEMIKQMKAWKDKVNAPTPEFVEELQKTLHLLNDLLEVLRDDQRFFG